MAGRRPILASLITDTYTFLRDSVFKAMLEPKPPAVRRAKRIKEKREKEQE